MHEFFKKRSEVLRDDEDAWKKLFIIRSRGCLVKEAIFSLGIREPGDRARQFLNYDKERMSALGRHSGIDFDSFWSDVRTTAAYYYKLRSGETRDDYVDRLYANDPVIRHHQRATR